MVVFGIPMSYSGPHQVADKFYARRLRRKDPMQWFEIEDVRQRRNRVLETIDLQLSFGDEVVNLELTNSFASKSGMSWLLSKV